MSLTSINSKQKFLDPKSVKAQLTKGFQQTVEIARSDLNRTSITWEEPITFEVKKNGDFDTEIFTDNQIWAYLNDGTKPHIIRPRRSKILRFRSQYKAKTAPNTLASRQGGSSGDYVFAKAVNHPGIAARNWTKLTADEAYKRLQKIVDKALKQ